MVGVAGCARDQEWIGPLGWGLAGPLTTKEISAVSTEVDDKEFVALNADTIQDLLSSGAQRAAERRGTDRRQAKRWPFPATVQLWFPDRSGEDVEILATCENLNDAGIGVSCERPFDVGFRLQIAIHQAEATYHGEGVVRHCTPSVREYFVGIELVEANSQ